MKRFKDFNRLYEFEENVKNPSGEKISFMDKLYDRIKKELIPDVPEEFKVDYDRGKEISIHTDNKKDMEAGVKLDNDKIVVYVNPVGEPQFEFNFNFNSASADGIIETLTSEFNKSENSGLSKGTHKPIERDLKSFRDEDEEDIDTPILGKPKKKKRSIKINIIKQVIEDAYVMDEIELNTVTAEELIRRMLQASRK
jgi:hypothetical protein